MDGYTVCPFLPDLHQNNNSKRRLTCRRHEQEEKKLKLEKKTCKIACDQKEEKKIMNFIQILHQMNE